MEDARAVLDFGSLFISPKRLRDFEDVVRSVLGKVEYEDISQGGYGEGQLVNERTQLCLFRTGSKRQGTSGR